MGTELNSALISELKELVSVQPLSAKFHGIAYESCSHPPD